MLLLRMRALWGFFKGINVGDSTLMMSYLFYADDALFLGEWSKENIENLVHILNCFYLA